MFATHLRGVTRNGQRQTQIICTHPSSAVQTLPTTQIPVADRGADPPVTTCLAPQSGRTALLCLPFSVKIYKVCVAAPLPTSNVPFPRALRCHVTCRKCPSFLEGTERILGIVRRERSSTSVPTSRCPRSSCVCRHDLSASNFLCAFFMSPRCPTALWDRGRTPSFQ
jgi:hypothetical protein